MSISTTSLDDLPNPSQEGAVNLKINDPTAGLQSQRDNELRQALPQAPQQASPEAINELVGGLQKAVATGLTELPIRDVPRDTVQQMTDQQIKPNYVPKHTDYIAAHNSDQDRARIAITQKANIEKTKDAFMEEIQGPIIIAAMYFIFQLPVVRGFLLKSFPSLFNEGGQFNLGGFIVTSIMFGGVYWGLNKASVMLIDRV